MLYILAIGNSFSQDATAYLHNLAEAGGYGSKVVNLYIPGCPLQKHWENAVSDVPGYSYELNGVPTGRAVSIKEALTEEKWDYVTLQQASHDSGLWETYQPYLENLSAYVKQYAPSAAQYIHETWAYEKDSTHGLFPRYDCNQQVMYDALSTAYRKAAALISSGFIPCGDVIQAVRALPEFDYPHGQSLCRDGFHMHPAYGRYLTAAVWYEVLYGGDITKNTYIPPVEADTALFPLIKSVVHKICSGYKKP